MRAIAVGLLMGLAACTTQSPQSADRPMDEVPVQQRLPGGDRGYRFANGCVVVLDAVQAVVKSAGDVCASYQRDIALLYASAD